MIPNKAKYSIVHAMIRTWLQASRLLAQANIATPLIFGQALAFAYVGVHAWRMTIWIHLYGLLNQLLIVYANDAIDHSSDRNNTTFNQFSGGSRVIPEGKLQPQTLLRAAGVVLILILILCSVISIKEQRTGIWSLAGLGLLTFMAYNFPPLRLSYRGYGEILQGIGTGVILPLVGFYLQTGSYSSMPWATLLPSFLLGVTSHILTSLPDFPSDKLSQKRSYAVRKGAFIARKHILYLLFVTTLCTAFIFPSYSWHKCLISIVPTLFCMAMCLRDLASADAENRQACWRFVFWGGAAINYLLISWSLNLVINF